MLASITPLGERGRHNRFSVTATAFALASTATAAAIGFAAGELGRLLARGGGDRWRVAALCAALALGLVADLGVRGIRLPSVRRQVNEDWLHEYRGWVYGAGFGAQLGAGVVTIVATAAVYVTLAAAVLVASPFLGALVVGSFGALRAAALAPAATVRTPGQLVALHARLAAWRPIARRMTLALDFALLCAALAALAV